MKQKILSLAIIAASLNATTVLAGDPKVYGKANLSLNQTDDVAAAILGKLKQQCITLWY